MSKPVLRRGRCAFVMDDVVANTTDHLPQDISDIDWTAVQLTHWRVYRHSQRRCASGINRSLELHRPARAGERTGKPMSYTKRLLDAELGQIDPQEEDRLIDEGRRYVEANIGGSTVMAEDITIADDMVYEPTVEQRKLALINRVKDIAPDWDEMTTRELLHLMAVSKVTLTPDAEMYIRQECNA